MQELLFEIGCEELPAASLRRAAQDLKSGIEERLRTAGVEFEGKAVLYTPRRLIVSLANVAERQPDQDKVQRGPAVGAAFDAEGRPTKALEGFCRGQGVDPKDVVTEDDYVWVKKTTSGRPTLELLQDILPAAICDVQFSKTMRWAGGSLRFARPVRWMLASFGGQVVPFKVEGIESGLLSRGHRFRSPHEFEAKTLDELEKELRARNVEPCFAERQKSIADGVAKLIGHGEPSSDLIEENANLTEWPEALIGEFKAEFLELPDPVLRTVMAKHERFFPVPGADGKLTNQFVSIRNGGEEAVVREGNAWVLNARFNDARFFYEEDKKHGLSEFLERTAAMTFQEKLGSVRQRADRLASLAKDVALWSGADDEEAGFAYEAGLYAKADLSTGLVSELDELQGVIGGEYARREGFADPVCWAIASHYDVTKNPEPTCPGGRTAVRLLIADQLDKLAGFLGVGFVPTGSSDPYGLRRAVTMLIEAAKSWTVPLPSYRSVFESACNGYESQGCRLDRGQALESLRDVFASRYEAVLAGRHDVCEAATLPGDDLLDPRSVHFRVKVMEALASDVKFVQTATRPANIVSAAAKKGLNIESVQVTYENLQSSEGAELLRCVQAQSPLAKKCAQAEDREGLIKALDPVQNPVNAFFDSTMVMVEDTQVRDARLKLLSDTADLFRLAGDFTKIVIEG